MLKINNLLIIFKILMILFLTTSVMFAWRATRLDGTDHSIPKDGNLKQRHSSEEVVKLKNGIYERVH